MLPRIGKIRQKTLLVVFSSVHPICQLAHPCSVHFWAPSFKWGISLANIADFNRPAEFISVPQQLGKYNQARDALPPSLPCLSVPLSLLHKAQ